jgi:hypothetical protein
MPGKAWKLDT